MRITIVKFTALFTSFAILLVFTVMALTGQFDHLLPDILADDTVSVKDDKKIFTVILDAGHGGEDGGASAKDGTLEKDLNLSLTLRLRDLLTAVGYRVLLTRTDDSMLGNGEPGYRKMADLRYRLDFANDHPEAVLISIHMNKFPEEYCSGVQLYYSPNVPESLKLATTLHTLVKSTFQPENKREIKSATSAIYLLDRVKIPAMLVECGFLSNTAEAELLKNENYQKQLALLITASINGYFAEIK